MGPLVMGPIHQNASRQHGLSHMSKPGLHFFSALPLSCSHFPTPFAMESPLHLLGP